ncbi:MAG: hypothetical protein A3G34_04410 [Candidatus Lindowbacteria bacterium RIFCSPLOWO2_12_FULL_62_27]|nr:MAG: hypothetical protein A3G34_04410 [Candidatus Lindowbacteria bacterium RIFCSPLOWO2_12_FULL_62_27]OGH61689.1 MAG: hypothetical protein A3I06_11695 [Candidatus Lindowbacteria bacterium RIFCSPLOWO2_02_FULL_62_12]
MSPGDRTTIFVMMKKHLLKTVDRMKQKLAGGAPPDAIRKELQQEGLSPNNVLKIMRLMKGEELNEDFPPDEVKDILKAKDNEFRIHAYKNLGFAQFDLVCHNKQLYVIQQTDTVGGQPTYVLKTDVHSPLY